MSPVSGSGSFKLTLYIPNLVTKGISANMLKMSSKRRRTRAQIQADKEAAAKREADEDAKDEEIHALQQQLMQLQEDHKTGAVAADLMNQFINDGSVEMVGEDSFVIRGVHGDKQFSASKKK